MTSIKASRGSQAVIGTAPFSPLSLMEFSPDTVGE
jgi:hypothetical protein